MSDEPKKFDNLEDANKYYADIQRGQELLNKQNENKDNNQLTKEDVTSIVAKALEENNKQKGDADARIKKVMLQDENTQKSIKKTFKEEKGYEEWEKEVKEGKVSIQEIDILHKRGEAMLKAEAKKAEKADEKNVEVPDEKNKQLGFEEGHNMIDKLLSDPKKNPNRPGLTPEQREKEADAQAKDVAGIVDRINKEGLSLDEQISLNVLNEMVLKGKTTSVNPDGSTVL